MLLRARVSAFLSGVAIAGVFAVYQLRKDVTDSHKILADQSQGYGKGLEDRVAQLEKAVADLKK